MVNQSFAFKILSFAQKEGAEARIIEVYFKTDINSYWTAFPNIGQLNLKIIRPKDAVTIIRQAVRVTIPIPSGFKRDWVLSNGYEELGGWKN
jgi:hypothetical protein